MLGAGVFNGKVCEPAMAGPAPQTDWYIAREGQQHGPLSDVEMRKFVELGHLRPTDLVWRQGFPDWRPAPAVFPATLAQPRPRPHEPPRAASQPTARPASAHPAAARAAAPRQTYRSPEPAMHTTRQVAVPEPYDHDAGDEDDDEDDLHPEPSRGRWRRIAKALVLVVVLGAAGWLAVDYIPNPVKLLNFLDTRSGSSGEPLGTQPAGGIGNNLEEIDASFQNTDLWQLIKREFPEWYQERVGEAAKLKSEGHDDASIARHLAQALVGLRRQHAAEALAASPEALRGVAASFLENLKHLSASSVQACYGFISQGETSPQVLELMGQQEHVKPLHRQAMATFAAVTEGRKSPRTHLPPRQTDYQALTQALMNRGWTDQDVQLFSNPKALAQAAPEVVCRLVQDWFAAQLSIADEDVQVRLLVESLKPVVAG